MPDLPTEAGKDIGAYEVSIHGSFILHSYSCGRLADWIVISLLLSGSVVIIYWKSIAILTITMAKSSYIVYQIASRCVVGSLCSWFSHDRSYGASVVFER